MSQQFQRRIEQFICDHCGMVVQGNGYTNHCPACLWSKHVDVHPGDRRATCRGMMEPIGVDQQRGEFKIIHRCTHCGYTKRNRLSRTDSRSVLAGIAAHGSS